MDPSPAVDSACPRKQNNPRRPRLTSSGPEERRARAHVASVGEAQIEPPDTVRAHAARRGARARAPRRSRARATPRDGPVVFRDTGHRTTERPSKGSRDVHTPTMVNAFSEFSNVGLPFHASLSQTHTKYASS
eukprot:3958041-Prymnesium_polylepis.1